MKLFIMKNQFTSLCFTVALFATGCQPSTKKSETEKFPTEQHALSDSPEAKQLLSEKPDSGRLPGNNTPTSSTDIKYKIVPQEELDVINKKISEKKITDGEEVARLYHRKGEGEGNYNYSITKKAIDDKTTEYTVTETGLPDDSVMGEMTILTIKKENGNLKVISIKTAICCWPGRGHTEWGTENCR
ncbi:MAG: hypothetical protein N2747_08320 [Chitinophagaceae bacterium]|nr:hypothetical protein [Chitinophagaceae bacterium]